MNLGLAIFLSAIFLGLIWLYSLTKDKISFNFVKKIKIKYLIIVFLIVIITITSYFYFPLIKNQFPEPKEVKFSQNLDNNDQPQSELVVNGLTLNESEKDVIFVMGAPTSKNELGYFYGSENWNSNTHKKHSLEEMNDYLSKEQLFVFIKNNKVIGLCDLKPQGLRRFFHPNDLFKTYGKPDTTLYTENDSLRFYFFKMHNHIVLVKHAFIRANIIFNPEYEDFFLTHIRQNNFLKYL